ncbi:MAG: hypothetical protein ACI9JM_003132 [Halioglobus sp.]|jgi:hypothetical protein
MPFLANSLTRSKAARHMRKEAQGSAAIEALMLIVFLVIPTWILLFNMGYSGMRLRDAQSASSLAGHAVVARKTEGKAVDASAIEKAIQQKVFDGEESALQVTAVEASDGDDSKFADSDLGVMGSLVSSLSGHSQVGVTVQRTSPFGAFANTPVELNLTVGGSPYTYCELKNKDFDPLSGGGNGADFTMGIIAKVAGLGNYVLAPFGGLPSGSNKCP